MLCDNCKQRDANVKYTQIVNGVKKEMHLCEKCSRELGINEMSFNIPINLSSFFGEFLDDYNHGFMPLLEKEKVLKCDKCNMTYDEFIESGKFGCSNCYDVFSANIDPILKRLHGSNRYIGRKAINNVSKKIKTKEQQTIQENANESKIKKLKLELNKMIKEEKYEEAAKIRDEIKKIEGR